MQEEVYITEMYKQTLEQLKHLRIYQNEMKEKLETNNKEIKALREEIKTTNEKWERKCNKLKVN